MATTAPSTNQITGLVKAVSTALINLPASLIGCNINQWGHIPGTCPAHSSRPAALWWEGHELFVTVKILPPHNVNKLVPLSAWLAWYRGPV